MTIRLNSFLRDLLFVLIAIYFAQGAFYATGSIVFKLVLFLILSISSYCLIKSLSLKTTKGIFYHALGALLLINTLGFLIAGSYGGIHFSQFRNILTALLPFFPFYYLAYKGYLTEKHLLRFFALLIPIAVATFYSSRSSILMEQLSDSENVVTNSAYFFVALIPYVFLLGKRKVLSALSMFLLLFFIIQSAKRGALIVGLAGSLVFAYYQLSIVGPKKKVRSYIAALVVISALFSYLYNFYLSNEFLINRMQNISDGGSGRDVIYSTLLNSWYESNSLINYLFGFGFVSVIKYSGGLLAHNDWLELLISFGLLGVFVYLLLFYAATRFVLNPKVEKESRLIMLAIILMWFLQTLFSMYYTESGTALTTVVLGYLIGSYQRKKASASNVKIEAQSTLFQ